MKVDFVFYLSLVTKFTGLFFLLSNVPLSSARSKFMYEKRVEFLPELLFFYILLNLGIFLYCRGISTL